MLTALYVVGSVALGAYRERRSDIDFVAVVDDELDQSAVRRLRLQHVSSALHTGASALRRRRSPLTGTCNGVFIRRSDLTRPVADITPLASHCGTTFTVGRAGPGGSAVNPVDWKVFAERAIAVRGPEPATLGLDPQPESLRPWNLGNLDGYWRRWAARAAAASHVEFRLRPRYRTAWGVLGAPRLHHTIATGDVISKEAAGEYALEVLPAPWHPLIADGLAYWRGEPDRLRLDPGQRARRTAEFVLTVADDAKGLPA